MFQALGHVLLCVLKSCKNPWWTWNFHCWKPKRSTTRSESQRSIAEQDCTVSDSIMWIDWTNVCCISLMLTVTCAPKGATKRWWLSVAVCAQADPAQRNSAERLDDIGGVEMLPLRCAQHFVRSSPQTSFVAAAFHAVPWTFQGSLMVTTSFLLKAHLKGLP